MARFTRPTTVPSNTHPISYVPFSNGELSNVRVPSMFSVRLACTIPLSATGPFGIVSSDGAVVSALDAEYTITQDSASKLTLEILGRMPGKARVSLGPLKVPVAGAPGWDAYLSGSREIQYSLAEIDVFVDSMDQRFICQVGADSVAVHASGMSQYALGSVLNISPKSSRTSIMSAIASTKKKIAVVAPDLANTIGPSTRHLVICAHSSAANVLAIGEGFRRSSDPNFYEAFGNDNVVGDATEFVALRGLFRVIWLMSCSSAGSQRFRDFVSGVAKYAGAWVVASVAPLPMRPRYRRDGGIYTPELPLLTNQIDWPPTPQIYPPGDGITLPSPVSNFAFLGARHRLGMRIVEYEGLDVGKDQQ